MLNKRMQIIGFICMLASVVLLFAGCLKKDIGYISSSMYYVENPMYIIRGETKTTASLEEDGSSNPLTVKIASIIDQATGKSVDSAFLSKSKITLYNGVIDYKDTTLEQLNAKLKDTVYAPLTINELGGRLQFSPLTRIIPGNGPFDLNLQVSNVRGSVKVDKATVMYLSNLIPDTTYGGQYAGYASDDGTHVAELADPVINISFKADTIRKVIFKFYDSAGAIYNPKKGGIGARKGRWNFKNFDPYYPENITDSSVEYEYPVVPSQFPIYQLNDNNLLGITPRGNFGTFYSIPGHNIKNSLNQGLSLYIFSDQAFFLPGVHTVSVRLKDIQWK